MRQCNEPGLRVDCTLDRIRIDRASIVRRNSCEGDLACQFHRAKSPAGGVVLLIGRNDVVAVPEYALEGHVESIGAVEREDESLWPIAVKELIQEMPAIIQGAFGGERHLVPAPAWVC